MGARNFAANYDHLELMPIPRCHLIAIVTAALIALATDAVPATVLPQASGEWPAVKHFFVPPLAFSRDGRYLAMAGAEDTPYDYCREGTGTCRDGFLHVWDVRSGRRVFNSGTRFPRVMSLLFSHDGKWIVTGHDGGAIRVWSLDTWRVVQEFQCCNRTWIRALALSPDGETLAIGAQSGQVVLWNMGARRAQPADGDSRLLGGHLYGVSALAFEPTGQYLLSAGDDQQLRQWDVRSGTHRQFSRSETRAKAHRGMVKTVAILNDRQAVSGSYWEGGTVKSYDGINPPDHVLRLWDLKSARPIRSYPLTWGIRCCIQVVNGGLIAFLKATTWDERPVLQIFNLATGAVERELGPTMGEGFHALAMHPDTRHFAIGLGDHQYLLWDRNTGQVLAQLVSAPEGWAVVAPDGRVDFSEGFRRWPCGHNILQACAGGRPAAPTPGLLATLLGPGR